MITKDFVFKNSDVLHRASVRNVYRTAEGREELIRMLAEVGTFREITPDEVDIRNFGIRKMEELGMLDIEHIRKFIDFFFTLPLVSRPTAEEMGEDISGDPL